MAVPSTETAPGGIPRQSMEADVICVGFGPATGGFLTTLARQILNDDGTTRIESRVAPGLPLQVICFERADDIGFGVSGAVTKASHIRRSFPGEPLARIPMAAPVSGERLVYLLDPIGASRRSAPLRTADRTIRALKSVLPYERDAYVMPFIPPFMRKDGGLVLSIGQFNQWVGSRLLATGAVQIWPSTPVASPLIEGRTVVGVQLVDQGTDREGRPAAGYAPGMQVRALLTVVGDGPVGAVGRRLDDVFGLPPGHVRDEWAVGMKVVVELAPGSGLEPGAIVHTFGYPEPEIFGFLYAQADGTASAGIFVPSWFTSPVRASYRYLQHWMLHPFVWRHLEGGRLRSWGAKSLQESGRRGEPHLAGNGYARIGESSGSTNVLTGSGIDEAWATGVQLAEAVLELQRAGRPFTKENLEATYIRRRRASAIDVESRTAEGARDGFHRGVVTGVLGMALAGFTRGRLTVPAGPRQLRRQGATIADFFRGRLPSEEIARIRRECAARRVSLHDALMDRAGWPPISFDGRLLVSHQDALLLGGKVQAPAGYADHVVFLYPSLCAACDTKVCIEICSGEAITPGEGGVPSFDRDKCVHCGACSWSCTQPIAGREGRTNIDFRAGAGGLHSGEN